MIDSGPVYESGPVTASRPLQDRPDGIIFPAFARAGPRSPTAAVMVEAVPPLELNPELLQAWNRALQEVRRSLPESTFEIWIAPLSLAGYRAGTVFLKAPERIRAWVEMRYAGLLADALSRALGRALSVSLEPPPDLGPQPQQPLNPTYTFERFVIGEHNHLAHAAALTVAEAPAEAYNPLFLHGPPGLGKTHLLCAIAHYLEIHAPALTVRYTTAESFTNEFVAALQSSGIEAFKRRYRDLDVLLVDDIQFLEGKQTTEEEFFHTFNALYEAGSQLVLSADRMPEQLSTLASRLRDRFEWGLIVDLGPPSLATRRTVLERLVREAGIEVEDAGFLTSLAQRVTTNIRQLHGSLTRLIAHASLTSRPLDSDLVESVFGSPQTSIDNRSAPQPEELQEAAARLHGITVEQLRGPSRIAKSVRARQMAILLTRETTSLSLPEIGRLFGGRDHSTIHNSLRRAKALVDSDPTFAADLNSLRGRVHSRTQDQN